MFDKVLNTLLLNSPVIFLSSQSFNTITLSVHKIIKHALKMFQQTLQNFWRVFDHFVETRRYKVERTCERSCCWLSRCQENKWHKIKIGPLLKLKQNQTKVFQVSFILWKKCLIINHLLHAVICKTVPQRIFTCSNLTIKRLEQGVKYAQR